MRRLLRRLWDALRGGTRISLHDRLVVRDNGRLVYDGPRADAPPGVRARAEELEKEAAELRREADGMFREAFGDKPWAS
jgi:hypothetical protein